VLSELLIEMWDDNRDHPDRCSSQSHSKGAHAMPFLVARHAIQETANEHDDHFIFMADLPNAQIHLILNSESFPIDRRCLSERLSCFIDNPVLLNTPTYVVHSNIHRDVFTMFIQAVNGEDIEVTGGNAGDLLPLCLEFGFGALAAECKKFQPFEISFQGPLKLVSDDQDRDHAQILFLEQELLHLKNGHQSEQLYRQAQDFSHRARTNRHREGYGWSLLKRAADSGHPDAALVYGYHLYRGESADVTWQWPEQFETLCRDCKQGVEDATEALRYLKVSADGGNPVAQLIFGAVHSDPREGVRYLRMSADQGNVDAECRYAVCLLHGTGIEINVGEAIQCLARLADEGNSDAQFAYGDCLFTGKGVDVDLPQAVRMV
jgi:hypothetical protein